MEEGKKVSINLENCYLARVQVSYSLCFQYKLDDIDKKLNKSIKLSFLMTVSVMHAECSERHAHGKIRKRKRTGQTLVVKLSLIYFSRNVHWLSCWAGWLPGRQAAAWVIPTSRLLSSLLNSTSIHFTRTQTILNFLLNVTSLISNPTPALLSLPCPKSSSYAQLAGVVVLFFLDCHKAL